MNSVKDFGIKYEQTMNKGRFFTKILQRAVICVVIITMITMPAGCTRAQKTEKTGFALDTFVQITIYDKIDTKVAERAVTLCSEYEDIFSAVREDSELGQLNKNGSGQVSDELLHVIRTGIEYGDLTGGAFDITILPVKELWDFSAGRIPSEAELAEALPKVDYRNIVIEGSHVTLRNGARIDLGAVAKGYIADRIRDYLISEGVTSAIINLGGNVLCIGGKPEERLFGGDTKKPFSVGIQKPFTENEVVDTVEIRDGAVVTSGVYQRCFRTEDGRLYHHLLNTETGMPLDNGICSVSIVADSSETADALSTAVFSLGIEKGKQLAEKKNAKVIFVTEDGESESTQ